MLLAGFALALIVPVSPMAAQQPTEHIDLNVIHKIKAAEGVGGAPAGAAPAPRM